MSLRRLTSLVLLGLVTLAFLASPVTAQITPPDADFDSIAIGPWFVPLVSGSPSSMMVNSVSNVLTLYPYTIPPTASGNLLRVDNSTSDQNADVILRFGYDCGGGSQVEACRVSFGYAAWSFFDGRGIEIHIDDDGTYSTPDDTWLASITGGDVEDGFEAEVFFDATNCSATHTLEFVVQGGALLMLDGVLAECLQPVSDGKESFGTLKGHFH